MPPVNRNKPVRAKSSESQYSLMEFMKEFPDDATCLEWLWRTRYSPNGIHTKCPRCRKRREFKRYETTQHRQSWTCLGCGNHLHPTAGTIFHKSSTSLHLWFYSIYLMTSTRCGISAKQLERELGVTYKTAWRIAHEVRHILMDQGTDPFSGAVEADETYMGGSRRGTKRGRPGPDSHKVAVFGNGRTWTEGTRSGRDRPQREEGNAPVARRTARAALLDCLHGRPQVLRRSWEARLRASPHQARRERLRERGCSYEHHRRVLVAHEAPRRLLEAPTGVFERVRVAVLAPERRTGAIWDTASTGGAGGDALGLAIFFKSRRKSRRAGIGISWSWSVFCVGLSFLSIG